MDGKQTYLDRSTFLWWSGSADIVVFSLLSAAKVVVLLFGECYQELRRGRVGGVGVWRVMGEME